MNDVLPEEAVLARRRRYRAYLNRTGSTRAEIFALPRIHDLQRHRMVKHCGEMAAAIVPAN